VVALKLLTLKLKDLDNKTQLNARSSHRSGLDPKPYTSTTLFLPVPQTSLFFKKNGGRGDLDILPRHFEGLCSCVEAAVDKFLQLTAKRPKNDFFSPSVLSGFLAFASLTRTIACPVSAHCGCAVRRRHPAP
jgi:hypothetical protein